MPIDRLSGLPSLDPTALRHRVLELVAHNFWSRKEMLAFQQAEERRALTRAVTSSHYYREVIGALVARNAALTDMPVLTKRLLMDNFDRIVTDPRLTRASIERHLDGASAGDLLLGEYRAPPRAARRASVGSSSTTSPPGSP